MALFKGFFAGNVLFYPGCLTKFVGKDIEANYKQILSKVGVEFIMLKDLEVCCGSPVMNSGHFDEATDLAKKNLAVFKEHSVQKIITACPACYKMFSKEYPRMLKSWDIEVEHITQIIEKAIKSGKYKPAKKDFVVTYHDPCHLGRHCGIYDSPREIIKSTGANLKEMRLNKEMAFCCGAGSGVKSNYPELANSAGKERIKMAKETKAKCLVTTCPMCFYNLKENSEDLEVMELSEFLEGGKNG
ncbi:MAG: (Fe-S)-binding protein [Candidatus Woesearchaeota archaeon]